MKVVQIIQEEEARHNRLYILDGEVCSWLTVSANRNTAPEEFELTGDRGNVFFRQPKEDVDRLRSILEVPGVFYAGLRGETVDINISDSASWDEVDPLLRDLFAGMQPATQQDWS